jgi:hypothetical protein
LVLAKALDISRATTMSLLFLAAKGHRITARDLSSQLQRIVGIPHRPTSEAISYRRKPSVRSHRIIDRRNV